MKIISKFYDVYDYYQNYEYESDIVYLRESKKLIENDNPIEFKLKLGQEFIKKLNNINFERRNSLFKFSLYGICGNWYLIDGHNYSIFEWKKKENNYDVSSKLWLKYFFVTEINSLNWIKNTKDELFIKFNSPLLMFTIDKHSEKYILTINPKLNNKILSVIGKTTWELFQEIEMYIGNILVKDKEISVVDEKYRKNSRFDKWSFRKKVK